MQCQLQVEYLLLSAFDSKKIYILPKVVIIFKNMLSTFSTYSKFSNLLNFLHSIFVRIPVLRWVWSCLILIYYDVHFRVLYKEVFLKDLQLQSTPMIVLKEKDVISLKYLLIYSDYSII